MEVYRANDCIVISGMNLALPLTRVKEAFERLDKYIFSRKEA